MRSPLLILLATSALAFTAACGTSEEEVPGIAASPTAALTPSPLSDSPAATPSPNPLAPAPTAVPAITPGPGVTLWRWGNAIVLVPDASRIRVARDNSGDSPSRGPSIHLTRGESQVLVDAMTGEVYGSQLQDADQSDLGAVTNSVRMVKADDKLPWPYDTKEPGAAKTRLGDVLYWEPSPAAGIIVGHLYRNSASGGDEVIYIDNTRSRRLIDAHTGEVLHNNDRIDPADEVAYERWTASVEIALP